MAAKSPESSITRRRFVLGSAMTAAASLASPGELLPQGPSAPPPAVQEAMAKLSRSAQAEVESKVAEIFRKYGSRLSDAQKDEVRKVIAETQAGLEKMRSFALQNGDQPATVLHIQQDSEPVAPARRTQPNTRSNKPKTRTRP